MATRNIDGNPVTRYQGRVTGAFDLADETDNFRAGDTVMAVVILDVNRVSYDPVRGDWVGTYRFKVEDFALVSDDVVRKNLYALMPHLEPGYEFPVVRIIPAIASEVASEGDYVELPETVVATGVLEPDYLADAETGEIFDPANESRERARLSAGGKDPVLQRFLMSGDL